MYLFVFTFMVMCYFTQTYEDEHINHLNFEEHKEEFESRASLSWIWATLKRRFSRIIFAATAMLAYSTGRIFHLENISLDNY